MSVTRIGSSASDASVTTVPDSGSVNGTLDVNFACDQEYETQFFGFTPKSFSDGMYNAISDYTWDYLHAAEEIMKAEFQSAMTEDQFKTASQAILPVLTRSMNKAFDKFETYLFTNIFHIPSHALLPEDTMQEKYQYTEEQEVQLDQQIQELKEKVKNSKYMSAYLRQQLEDLSAVEEQYQLMMKQQQTLDRLCRESGVAGLQESLEFTQDRVKKLHSLMERFEPLGPKRKPLDDVEERFMKMQGADSTSLSSQSSVSNVAETELDEPVPMVS